MDTPAITIVLNVDGIDFRLVRDGLEFRTDATAEWESAPTDDIEFLMDGGMEADIARMNFALKWLERMESDAN